MKTTFAKIGLMVYILTQAVIYMGLMYARNAVTAPSERDTWNRKFSELDTLLSDIGKSSSISDLEVMLKK